MNDTHPYPKRIRVMVEYFDGNNMELESVAEKVGDLSDVDIDPDYSLPDISGRYTFATRQEFPGYRLAFWARKWTIKSSAVPSE